MESWADAIEAVACMAVADADAVAEVAVEETGVSGEGRARVSVSFL